MITLTHGSNGRNEGHSYTQIDVTVQQQRPKIRGYATGANTNHQQSKPHQRVLDHEHSYAE